MTAILIWVALSIGCGDDSAAGVDAGIDAGSVPDGPVIETRAGAVRGSTDDGVSAFLGIPYAEPPVGELRWRAPVPHAGWDGVRDATRAPQPCPQTLGITRGVEDCLIVNVHTPDPMPDGAPVLVWIHGGAFIFGEGLMIDGSTAGDVLAREHGLVVVSMHYRLGVLGFLASDALGSTGNEGFLDQQLALGWVRDNITAFGGDPGAVTIVGESAGGLSVCLHMLSPGSAGLFHRAISQSGLCDAGLPAAADAQATGETVIAAAGCAAEADVGACMRALSVRELAAASASTGDAIDMLVALERQLWPSVDGTVIPGDFQTRVEAGEVAHVPAIFGWTRDEGTLFVALAEQQGAVIDESVYDEVVERLAAAESIDPATIRGAYPLASYDDPGAAIGAILGHHRLACPSRRAAHILSASGLDPWVYRFDYPDAGFILPVSRTLGAFHSAEVQFVFGHAVGDAFTPDEQALHEAMSGYWARLVASGDPNGDGALPWPVYDAGERAVILDRTVAESEGVERDACALWDAP